MEIPGYENYVIQTDGTVMNKKTGRALRYFVNERGYRIVCLWKDGIQQKMRVHRLLAHAYIPNPEGKPMVDHIDRCRQNNDLTNLRWVDACENRHNGSWRDNPMHNIEYRASRSRYYVTITRRGKRSYVGNYKTLDEAKAARDEWYSMHTSNDDAPTHD